MAVKNIVLAIPLTSISSTTFNSTYQLVNTGGLPHACFLLKMTNNSNVDITISYDGVNDHDFLRNDDELQIASQTNSQPNNFVALFGVGLKVYVKGIAGMGSVYLAGYYQPQG